MNNNNKSTIVACVSRQAVSSLVFSCCRFHTRYIITLYARACSDPFDPWAGLTGRLVHLSTFRHLDTTTRSFPGRRSVWVFRDDSQHDAGSGHGRTAVSFERFIGRSGANASRGVPTARGR